MVTHDDVRANQPRPDRDKIFAESPKVFPSPADSRPREGGNARVSPLRGETRMGRRGEHHRFIITNLPPLRPMSTAPAPLAASGSTAAKPPFIARYKVNLTVDPTFVKNVPPLYFQVLLGANGSPQAVARLANFTFGGGGGLNNLWFNHGSSGSIAQGIVMQCWPQTPPPQVLAAVMPGTTSIAFDLLLQTHATQPDWITFWFLDHACIGLPTTAAGHPGLFANVSWAAGGIFTPAGYVGNGVIDGLSDTGFTGTITPAT